MKFFDPGCSRRCRAPPTAAPRAGTRCPPGTVPDQDIVPDQVDLLHRGVGPDQLIVAEIQLCARGCGAGSVIPDVQGDGLRGRGPPTTVHAIDPPWRGAGGKKPRGGYFPLDESRLEPRLPAVDIAVVLEDRLDGRRWAARQCGGQQSCRHSRKQLGGSRMACLQKDVGPTLEGSGRGACRVTALERTRDSRAGRWGAAKTARPAAVYRRAFPPGAPSTSPV